VRPAFPYYGGKARLAATIAALIPPHRLYLEPFAGSAAVLLAKKPSKHEVLNDADGNVVAFYRALREHPVELQRALTLTPYSREEYTACADMSADLSPVERARRFVVRASQSINAAGAAGSPGWALSTTRNQSRPGTFAGAADRLDLVAERLRRVYIEHADAVDVIERHGKHDDAVIYADPPYLRETRSSAVGASAYRLDTNGPAEHAKYLDALNACEALVVLSGYDSPLYRERLAGWTEVPVAISKPSANRSGRSATGAAEVLWIKPAGGQA
jgi:DNA adenine methylase